MSDLTEVNKWAAEQIGIKIYTEVYSGMFMYKGETYHFPWTLDDERCVKMFRDWWLAGDDKVRSVLAVDGGVIYFEVAQKIASEETEKDCITKLWEASL